LPVSDPDPKFCSTADLDPYPANNFGSHQISDPKPYLVATLALRLLRHHAAYIQRPSRIARQARHLARHQLNLIRRKDGESLHPTGDDHLELLLRVGLEVEAVEAESTDDPHVHVPLRQVHRVGHGHDDEPAGGPGRPFEHVVQDGLLALAEHVQLVDEEDGGDALGGVRGEARVEALHGLVGDEFLAGDELPHLHVGLNRGKRNKRIVISSKEKYGT